MEFLGKFVTVLLGFAVSSTNSPKPLSEATVSFPGIGPVSIRSLVKQGDYPRLVFRTEQNNSLLLNAQVGTSDYWKEFVSKEYPLDLDQELRFLVLHRAGLPDPLIVALAKRQGGSDCGLEFALFGVLNGKLSELSPPLPDSWLRGGAFLAAATGTKRVTLTVTSERYQPKDVHVTGPSHMAVFVYAYDPSQGRFIETRQTEINTDDMKVSGESLAALFGDFATC